MNYTLKPDYGTAHFTYWPCYHVTYMLNSNNSKLGRNTLLYNWAKHRLRLVIVQSALTDLLRGALIGCETNHLMKHASRGSLDCQHITPVMQQPAANQNSVSLQEVPGLPAAQAAL